MVVTIDLKCYSKLQYGVSKYREKTPAADPLKTLWSQIFLFKLFKGGWHITLVLKYRVQLFGVIFDIWSRRVMKIWPRAYIWTLSSIKKMIFKIYIFKGGSPLPSVLKMSLFSVFQGNIWHLKSYNLAQGLYLDPF